MDVSLRNAMFASALYNSSAHIRAKTARDPLYLKAFFYPDSFPRANLQITERIQDCTSIACHIDRNRSLSHQRDLTRMFCNAASTSIFCWEYTFLLVWDPYMRANNRTADTQHDIHLEAALLIACGYELADVKKWMMILGTRNQLKLCKEERETWCSGFYLSD
jgi:hypothetical protein